MTYNEMNFKLFRKNSSGYRTAFENGLPLGYGEEVDVSEFLDKLDVERRVDDCVDSLHDSTTPLYRAADGKLYKVYISGSGSVKVWARASLLPDRAKRIAEFRRQKGTLKDVEQTSGIPVKSISRLETGERDVLNVSGKVLLKLADALGITIEEIVR